MLPITDSVLGEVKQERAYQDKLWNNGGRDDTTSETDESFTKYIHEYLDNEIVRGKPRTQRERFLKAAALAVAAIERIDKTTPHGC